MAACGKVRRPGVRERAFVPARFAECLHEFIKFRQVALHLCADHALLRLIMLCYLFRAPGTDDLTVAQL